jgi:GNAT superfamily N-acetyltransferase
VTDLQIRPAIARDIPDIVAMLFDDELGAQRETPGDLTPYLRAFELIDSDPRQHLLVAVHDGKPAGTLQLTLIAGLSRQGATRAVIEAVRVRSDLRGEGIGSGLVQAAVQRARELGASMVQLTSDATRVDAHRFYRQLGFEQSHVGFKLPLP